jgi:glycosyltransferase involved in cell wall biosynthesis
MRPSKPSSPRIDFDRETGDAPILIEFPTRSASLAALLPPDLSLRASVGRLDLLAMSGFERPRCRRFRRVRVTIVIVSRRPSISVLLPVFNGARYLPACLESLASQTCGDFEVVAVDDGSTDATPTILDAWQRRDRRLRVVRTAHRGLVATLNTGLEKARAALIARMDADDIAMPRRFELQRRALEARPRIDVVGCQVIHFSSQPVGLGFQIYERWLNSLIEDEEIRRDMFVESPLAHPSVIYRRRAVLAVGGYRDRGWPEDYDLWLRLADRGAVFSKVRESLLRWRDHSGRMTRTDRRYAVEKFIECKAHHLSRGPLSGRKRVVIWGAGQTGRRLSKHLLRRDAPLEAFVDIDPAKCGRELRGVPILDPDQLERLGDVDSGRPLLLAAVASRGARRKIRRHLDGRGWRETKDYWCVA